MTYAELQYTARQAVRAAVADGPLPAVYHLRCVDCGAEAQVYHHYLGYDEEHWLDVRPMCDSCHSKEHWRLIPDASAHVAKGWSPQRKASASAGHKGRWQDPVWRAEVIRRTREARQAQEAEKNRAWRARLERNLGHPI